MFSKRRLVSLLLVMMLLVTFLAACTPEADDPVVDPPVIEDPVVELVPEEVIMEAVESYLKDGVTDFLVSGRNALDLLAINPNGALIVDLRSAADYAEGHIMGAINIPYAEFGEKMDVLPVDKPVYIICYSGQTSAQAAVAANLVGIDAYSFQSGMNFGFSTLEDKDEWLETTENALPEPRTLDLDEEAQILWDAATGIFSSNTNYVVGATDVAAIVEDNPDVVFVLDMRAEDDYNEGHIEGAVHIPFAEVGNNLDSIPNNRPIYVVCYSGQTAGAVLGALRVADYNIMSLNRGMIGWNGAELPLVTE